MDKETNSTSQSTSVNPSIFPHDLLQLQYIQQESGFGVAQLWAERNKKHAPQRFEQVPEIHSGDIWQSYIRVEDGRSTVGQLHH